MRRKIYTNERDIEDGILNSSFVVMNSSFIWLLKYMEIELAHQNSMERPTIDLDERPED